jgi:hypothetical protein
MESSEKQSVATAQLLASLCEMTICKRLIN